MSILLKNYKCLAIFIGGHIYSAILLQHGRIWDLEGGVFAVAFSWKPDTWWFVWLGFFKYSSCLVLFLFCTLQSFKTFNYFTYFYNFGINSYLVMG